MKDNKNIDGVSKKAFINHRSKSWTKKQDQILTKLVKEDQFCDWQLIAENFPKKTSHQCRQRWNNVLNNRISKGPWTEYEDNVLRNVVLESNGIKSYKIASKALGGTRTPKQCRERFFLKLCN